MKNNQKIICLIMLIFILLSTIAFTPVIIMAQRESNQSVYEFYKVNSDTFNYKLYGLEINERILEEDQKLIIEFYNQYTNNSQISKSIIEWALYYEMPVCVCFAIAYVESGGYNHQAIGYNNYSCDWGLFQLNDKYRKNWTREDFFNIDKNTEEGIKFYSISYNRFINTKGITFTFLGYNMGLKGADQYEVIPSFRQGYVNNILEHSGMLEDKFNERFNKIIMN